MKKFLSLILALALVLSLVACGETNEQSTTQAAGNNESTAAAGESTTEVGGNPESKVVAGFICLHNEQSTYDLNFINAAKEACEAAGIKYVIKTNIDESERCLAAAEELVEDEGCNFVFADSFGHEPYMIQAAKEYPDVYFAHGTGTQAHTAGLDNFSDAFASIYEGRFLAGVAAGLKLNEMIEAGTINAYQAKIGYVGAYNYAEVISGYTSFFLGARYVCPTVTMDVSFTSSWYDEAAEYETAINLIEGGAVLVSQHADSMGAPRACEEKGVPNVSYNGATDSVGPNTFIISSRINWAPYFSYCISCVDAGEKIAADYTGSLANGGVELSYLGKAAAEGTAEKLEEVKAKLLDGSLHVYDTSTFTVGGQALTSYLADVDDFGDYVGETEVVSDGYFHESEYRSAPYFNIAIDGITVLGN